MSNVIDATLRFVDKFTSPMTNAVKGMERCSKQAKRMGKEIQDAGKNISKVGSTLTTSLTLPILGIGAAAVKTSADFESQMSRVEAIAEASASDMKLLTQQAIDLGASSVYSAKEVAEGMENMASAGFTTTEIMDSMAGMLNLAASGGEGLAIASDIAASTVRGFGLEAKETAHVADVLAQAAAKTNAAISDTGEAMKYAAPIANATGISLEETAAAIGIMANAGIKGSQAGTTIRGAMTRMVKPTKSVVEAMDELGVKFYDSDGKMYSLAENMQQLREKTKGLSEEEKNNALSRIFGTNALSGMLALVNSSPRELENLTASLEKSDGAAQKMAETMMDNTNGAIEEMKGSLETCGIVLGGILIPYVTKAVKKITELTNKFGGLSTGQQKTILKIAGIVAAVGPAIMVFGKLVTGVGKVVAVVGKVGGAIKSAGGIMAALASPAGIVIAVVAAIAVAAFLIIKNWTKVKAFLINLGTSIKSVFTRSGGDVGKFSKLFIKAKDVISRAITNLKPVFAKIIEFAKPILIFFANAWLNKIKVIFSVMAGFVSGVFSTIGDYISGLLTVFDGITIFLNGVFTGNWSKAWEGIKTIFSGVFQSLVSLCKMPINAVIGLINGAIGGINKLGLTIPDWVPLLGGKSFSINVPTIPFLAKGTNNWGGGLAVTQEKGGEIMDLPRGTRVYPHDKSIQMARAEGASGKGSISINIAKLADKIEVRNDKDLDSIVEKLASKLEKIVNNTGEVVPV